ncbi:MAG: AraC family transcriptional regulator, partial [Alphaproteobacteria bacterium]
MSGNPRPIVALGGDYPRGHEIAPHRHARAQLVYASQGVMTVTAAAGSWVVPPQRAVWMPAGAEHRIRVDRDLSMRSLYVRPDAVAGLPGACRVVAVSALLRALILRAMTVPPLYDEDGPDGRVLRVLLDELRTLPSVPLHLPQPRDARLKRVTDALLAEPADLRPLDAWARQAGASPRTLARLFLAETGLGFRAWRQRARLLHALVALADDEPVTRVAFEAGYDSPSAF